MGVVGDEPVCADGISKGVTIGDDEYQNLLGILDFPMESLEGDYEELGGDWDATKSQSLGPIPADALMGLPPVPEGNLGNAFRSGPLKFNAPGGGTHKPKQLPKYAKQSSSGNVRPENTLSDAQESGIFQTQSPVSVLESGGSCPGGKNLPIKPDIAVPVRTRSKRARASMFNPWFVMTPITSATSAFKKTSSYKKPKEKKEKFSEGSLSSNNASEITVDSFKQEKEESFYTLDVGDKDEISLQRSLPAKKCTHCQVTKTPQWREGPMGPKTLCNACGVRYRSGRLFPEYRPLASPTFVPTLHSNSHRKVVEMRKKTIVQEDGTILDTPMSPAAESSPQPSNPRKVLGTRNKAIIQEKEFVYDASVSQPPEYVPKRRKVMSMRKQGGSMQENDIMHNTFISPAPEFVPTLDSHSSEKFIGMRKKAIMQETHSVLDAPMSPAPEFVPMSSYLFDFIY